MVNVHAFAVSDCIMPEGQTYRLAKNIAAIQVFPAEGAGEPKLGMITQLPQGAELEPCGGGFNERTLRVRWADGFYFVFLQDLDTSSVAPQRTAGMKSISASV